MKAQQTVFSGDLCHNSLAACKDMSCKRNTDWGKLCQPVLNRVSNAVTVLYPGLDPLRRKLVEAKHA